MTKNEAYLYAKSIRRAHYTNKQLEEKMSAEGYTVEDFKQVKQWLSHKRVGI